MNIREIAETIELGLVFESSDAALAKAAARGKEALKYFSDQYNRGQSKKEIVQNMQVDLEGAGLDSVKADKTAQFFGDVYDALKADKVAKTDSAETKKLFMLATKGKLKAKK